jgi:predicted transcriptional regulator
MNNIELKYDLVRLIMELEDTRLLQQLRGLIAKERKTDLTEDWANELTEFQRQQIELGKLQIQNGNFTSHEEVEAEIDAMLEQKRKNKA